MYFETQKRCTQKPVYIIFMLHKNNGSNALDGARLGEESFFEF